MKLFMSSSPMGMYIFAKFSLCVYFMKFEVKTNNIFDACAYMPTSKKVKVPFGKKKLTI